MSVDADLAHLLLGPAEIGNDEQAFVFLTVDEYGYAHPALLSRAELDVSPDGLVLAVVASTRTKANLARDRRATLIAVDGTVAHYAKLHLIASIEDGHLLGASFDVAEHKRDSIGIELAPITFRASAALAELEHWSSSARLIRALIAGGTGLADG
jgi:hypothetical protein